MSQRDEERFETLKRALVEIGYFRRGTLLHRFVRCGSAACSCHADPPKLHGPYYDWTRKVKGKTVTVRLNEEQAHLLEKWIANARRLDEIIDAMDEISARVTDPLLQAVGKKRRHR